MILMGKPWLMYMLKGLGIETGIDFDATVKIGEYITRATGKTNASRVGRAIAAKMNGRSS